MSTRLLVKMKCCGLVRTFNPQKHNGRCPKCGDRVRAWDVLSVGEGGAIRQKAREVRRAIGGEQEEGK